MKIKNSNKPQPIPGGKDWTPIRLPVSPIPSDADRNTWCLDNHVDGTWQRVVTFIPDLMPYHSSTTLRGSLLMSGFYCHGYCAGRICHRAILTTYNCQKLWTGQLRGRSKWVTELTKGQWRVIWFGARQAKLLGKYVCYKTVLSIFDDLLKAC